MARNNISCSPAISKRSPDTHRLDYRARITKGHSFENELAEHLIGLGIITTPFGRALLSKEFQSDLEYLNDPTSAFLRYLPDLAGRLPNFGSSFLIEAKCVITSTGNYSINLSSYIMQRDLVLNYDPLNSLRILYVFTPPYQDGDYRACWIQNLHRAIIRQVSEPKLLTTVRGSRLPYALLDSDRLKPLSTVLSELIEPNHDQRVGDKRVFKIEEYVNGLYGR